MNRLAAAALLTLLTACGTPPKPAVLLSYEELRRGDGAAALAARQPELHGEAEAAYQRALAAYEDNEPDDATHHTRVAHILWRTAVAKSQIEDRRDAAKAAKKRLETAEDALQDATRRKALAEDGINRQTRIIEMQLRLAEAEANTRQVKRAADAQSAVDAAALKVQEAERLDAARHAPGQFNKASAALKLALDQLTAGDYRAAEQSAALVAADADAAITAARPHFALDQQMRDIDTRMRAILDAAAQIPGAEARLEARGAVITLRDLFAAGKRDILPERQLAVQLAARVAKDQPAFKLIVEGHTDNRGGKTQNLEVSRDRAQAVAGFMMGQGVDGQRITALGRGDDEPIADNSTADGRAQNRRVDIVFIRPTRAELAQ